MPSPPGRLSMRSSEVTKESISIIVPTGTCTCLDSQVKECPPHTLSILEVIATMPRTGKGLDLRRWAWAVTGSNPDPCVVSAVQREFHAVVMESASDLRERLNKPFRCSGVLRPFTAWRPPGCS
jgi:hypothetical protein